MNRLAQDQDDQIIDRLNTTMDMIRSRFFDYSAYAACFSEFRDDAAQWERYANRGKGVCLGFQKSMLKKLAGVSFAAVLWYQGCADADKDNAAVYAESFARMVKDVRREAGWTVPFFTVQLNRYETQPDAASWGRIKEIQRQAALEMDRVWILPSAGIPQGDEIHSSAAGNVMLGEMLARQAHGALNGGAPFEAPNLASARLEENFIRLSFRNASGLMRPRSLHDASDFSLTDDQGENRILSVAAQESDLLLKPARAIQGKAYISYGCHPQGPEGAIVDQQTYLPILSFDHVEVF